MNPPRKITPNPGGQIAPEAILGRDDFISDLWKTLEGQSVYMDDLRRIGKTQILVKMQAQTLDGWHVVKRDLGSCYTAAEFATQVYRDASSILGKKQIALRSMENLLGKAGGTEIAGILKLPGGSAAPWKEVLLRTFSDIEEQMISLEKKPGQHERMLFLWDEVPFLLDNIRKRESPEIAMEVFDTLRSYGQDHDHIRLLLTGSIGLHHILSQLHDKEYIGSPLNRMDHKSPGPLMPDSARDLATRLLRGAAIKCDDLDHCAEAVANSSGFVAYYIQKLVSRLPKEEIATPQLIETVIEDEIASDSRDDWDLGHYRNRLRAYYAENENLALQVLDTIAAHQGIDYHGIRQVIATTGAVDEELLRKILKLLCRDHYIVRSKKNEYTFYIQLVWRWWTVERSI